MGVLVCNTLNEILRKKKEHPIGHKSYPTMDHRRSGLASLLRFTGFLNRIRNTPPAKKKLHT
jgi:hypothetical protein